MYIKQIIIQGFKSYKDQTVIEPFSPKHNVIVGRNGSGKSNFFAAIRFVLSDQYTQLGREDRQGLLHEGAGSAVMSAYVELIFDNADERFPTNTPEVILRRTIGQKKDEYSLNRKNTTKQEVMNILESAGFSRSNPYYIVPQGRVTAITNMKDPERLAMLKTVAGTEVYESRRSESRKIMDETEHKRAKIDDLLDQVRGRLGELEEEKEELRAFQDKDRERRCLEYTIHHKDQESLEEALGKLSDETEGGVEQTDDNREALRESEHQLDVIDGQIRELQQQIQLLNGERAQYKEDRIESARVKAQAESDVQGMVDGQTAAQQARTQRANEATELQQQIKQYEADLAQLLPSYHAKRDEERSSRQQIDDGEASRQRLYAKQGRQSHFRTKKERDDWLRQEIRDLNNAIATRKALSLERTEDIQALETKISQLEAENSESRSRIDNRGDEQQTISAEVQRAKDEKERLSDQRKELWREEAKLDSIIDNARQEYDKADRELSYMMDQDHYRGLLNVRKIIEKRNVQGTHGTIGELFQYPSRYKTAAEITAGMSLFDFVVDNDDIASDLVEILKKEKLGRVTFVPLNRVKAPNVNMPKANDAVPLISKLKYDARFDGAMQGVFGRTIVCPNLQVASQYARSHNLSAITPEGDRSDNKGALTGGYHDEKKSRLTGIANFVASRDEKDRVDGRKEEIRTQLNRLDQEVTKASSTLQKIEQKRSQLETGYGPLRDELRKREAELNGRRDEFDRLNGQLEEVKSLERSFAAQLDGYQSELTSDFKKALSNDEERQLDALNNQLPDWKKQHQTISGELSELENQKSNVELTLKVNLRPRLDQLESEELDLSVSTEGGSSAILKERQSDLKRADKALKTIDARLDEIEQSMDQAQEQLSETNAGRAKKHEEVERLEHLIRNHQRMMEKGAQKKAALNLRLNEVKTHINGLGVLPDAAFTTQYQNLSANTATSRLHKVKESLKKYGHVNKKAFEQFTQFEQSREKLESRRKELDASDTSIRELIDVLDQRKDEAIERTFKQVSREFARIFERLVPAGKGRLVIQRRTDKQANGGANVDDESEEEDQPRTAVENYTGVGITVSFNSKHDEQQRIQQLSGGQKSLCALALVFAIQASDPAPFYLFDEIDANLDAQYRTAVAELLQESSQTGQFICTTFRPEMLFVAEKVYGVNYQHKASSIDVVSREAALQFIEGEIGGK